MAYSRGNGLSKAHASMLHAFCACNYIRLPLTRQHKTSVFVSRSAPLRHFSYTVHTSLTKGIPFKSSRNSFVAGACSWFDALTM